MRVDEEDRKTKLLAVLSDPVHRRILSLTMPHPKAIGQLANEIDIPLSTCYKFVHELVEAGLMAVERSIITDEGKRYDVYRSLLIEMRLFFDSDRLVMDLIPKEDATDKFYRLWSTLRKGKF